MTDLAPHLGRWRASRRAFPGALGTEAMTTEQAKGVLMLRYGITSYEALAVLLRWSKESASSVGELSRALTHGVCQGRGLNSAADAWLVRWLEQQLRSDVSALLEVDRVRGS